ncbi:MAG: hypothetical protein GWP27_04170 [Bacteroidetes bacterium]|nr:hypothetical protein [Bacteroidota bacterium]
MKYVGFCLFLLVLIVSPAQVLSQHKYIKKVDKYLSTGDRPKALTKLDQYIKKKSDMADLYLKRAKLKIEQGDLGPAMLDINTFCSLNRICGEAEFLKGLILYRQRNCLGAIEPLGEYTRKFDNADGWYYLALSHMWIQNYSLAAHGFKRAIEAKSDQPDIFYNAGLASYYNNAFAKSDSLFGLAIQKNPQDLDAMIAKSLALSKMEAYAESNKILRAVLDIDPSNGKALYNIGVNYYDLNERDLACDYWSRSAELEHKEGEEAKMKYCGKKKKRKGRKK